MAYLSLISMKVHDNVLFKIWSKVFPWTVNWFKTRTLDMFEFIFSKFKIREHVNLKYQRPAQTVSCAN